MLRKIINSLALVGLMLTISPNMLSAKPSFTDKMGYAAKNITKEVLKLSKKGGTVVAVILATGFFGKWVFSRFIERPLNKGGDAAVGAVADGVSKYVSPGFGSFIKKTFIDDKDNLEDRLKNQKIFPKDVEISFADKLGNIIPGSIDPEIKTLKDIIDDKRMNPNSNSVISRFIILEGPSHIGKSHSAIAIADELGAKKYFQVTSTSLQGGIVGETQKIIRAVFDSAKKIATDEHPCIVILDEIDYVVRRDDKYAETALGTFHEIMDEMDRGGYENVYLIATTNNWQSIKNERSTLANRFIKYDGVVSTKLPSSEKRKTFLDLECKKAGIELQDQELETIKINTVGCNLADLQRIVTKLRNSVSSIQRAQRANVNNFRENISINLQAPKKTLLEKVKTTFKPVLKPFTSIILKTGNQAPRLANIVELHIELDPIIREVTGREIINIENNQIEKVNKPENTEIRFTLD